MLLFAFGLLARPFGFLYFALLVPVLRTPPPPPPGPRSSVVGSIGR